MLPNPTPFEIWCALAESYTPVQFKHELAHHIYHTSCDDIRSCAFRVSNLLWTQSCINEQPRQLTMADTQQTQVPFGRPMRKAHFNFAPSYTPLNHGAFGTYPTSVRKRLRHCQELAEARPDTFIRFEIPKALDSSRVALGSFLNVPASEVVLVQNATTGVNTVLRSLRYDKGDVILYFSTLYGACERTVSYICETTNAESLRIDVRYPCKDEEVIERFRTAIRDMQKANGKRARVAIFDTVTSLPGVRVPWETLCNVCKEERILSLVDGAHGIGHINLDLNAADPDFFVSNCHK